jgi:hypothetical protein
VAASANIAQPIRVWKVQSAGAGAPQILRRGEDAGETGNFGVPVQVEVASGFIQECAAITSVATALIAGISNEPFSNLTTDATAKTLTYGKVQNQSSAVLIPVGAPPNDGTIGFYQVSDEMVFVGVLGNSSTAANATIAQTDLGATFGLTQDATNKFWYIDNFKTAASAGACVVITELIDAVATLNGREAFKVLHAAQQLLV